MNSDSAVPGLNREIALSTEIKIAPLSKMHEFNQIASPFINKISVNQKPNPHPRKTPRHPFTQINERGAEGIRPVRSKENKMTAAKKITQSIDQAVPGSGNLTETTIEEFAVELLKARG